MLSYSKHSPWYAYTRLMNKNKIFYMLTLKPHFDYNNITLMNLERQKPVEQKNLLASTVKWYLVSTPKMGKFMYFYAFLRIFANFKLNFPTILHMTVN